MQPEQPTKKKTPVWLIAVGGVLLLCFCVAVVIAIGSSGSTNNPSGQLNTLADDIESIQTAAFEAAFVGLQAKQPTNTPFPTNTNAPPPPTDTATVAPTADPNLIRPGTYIVGSDIQPGIYTGNAGEGLFGTCYWERLKDLSGSFDAILANDNGVGNFYLEIRQGDYALKTDCELAYLPTLPAPPAEFPSGIMAGTYLVGIDIQPGTYQGQAGTDVLETCYWERLSNVSGEFDGILANDNGVGQYYVQVQPGDFALKTGCELERIGD